MNGRTVRQPDRQTHLGRQIDGESHLYNNTTQIINHDDPLPHLSCWETDLDYINHIKANRASI